jgi:hypothetical protein
LEIYAHISKFSLNFLYFQEGRAPVIISDSECYRTSLDIDVIMVPDSVLSAREVVLQQFDYLVEGKTLICLIG